MSQSEMRSQPSVKEAVKILIQGGALKEKDSGKTEKANDHKP